MTPQPRPTRPVAAMTPHIVDGRITALRRTHKRTLSYTLQYDDGLTTVTVKGATHQMCSAFVPYGIDIDTMPDGEQTVAIPCEYNVVSKRITNVPMPRLTLEPPKPPPYDVLVRKAAQALIAAMRSSDRTQHTVLKDVQAAMRVALITSEAR